MLTTDLKTLSSLPVKKIAIANPKTAPYGVAAVDAMKYYGVYEKVKDRLVYGESAGQTQQFIATQAAEIGFIAKSMALSGEMKDKGKWIEIDTRSYTPIRQGAVLLKHGKDTNEKASNLFYKYLFSPAARSVFKKYGYIVSNE